MQKQKKPGTMQLLLILSTTAWPAYK